MMKSKFKFIIFIFAMLLFLVPKNNSLIQAGEKEEPINYSNNYEGLYNKVKDGVIVIHNVTNKGISVGTGMIYKEDSSLIYSITNYHVIDDFQKIYIDFNNGEYKEAFYVGGDEYMDIAVLACPKPSVYKVLTFGNSKYTKIGEEVMAVGNPVSSTLEYTVTKGIISNLDVEISYGDFYKDRHVTMVDMSLNPGNSGGPTFNIYGQVIGVNSIKYTNDGKDYFEGLNFMIPINDALMVANRIEHHKYHTFVRPYMGNGSFYNIIDFPLYQKLEVGIPKDLLEGVYISSLDKERNPLLDCGIKEHSVIIELAGQKVENLVQLRRILYFLNIYQQVEIKYLDLNEDAAVIKTANIKINALVFEGGN